MAPLTRAPAATPSPSKAIADGYLSVDCRFHGWCGACDGPFIPCGKGLSYRLLWSNGCECTLKATDCNLTATVGLRFDCELVRATDSNARPRFRLLYLCALGKNPGCDAQNGRTRLSPSVRSPSTVRESHTAKTARAGLDIQKLQDRDCPARRTPHLQTLKCNSDIELRLTHRLICPPCRIGQIEVPVELGPTSGHADERSSDDELDTGEATGSPCASPHRFFTVAAPQLLRGGVSFSPSAARQRLSPEPVPPGRARAVGSMVKTPVVGFGGQKAKCLQR